MSKTGIATIVISFILGISAIVVVPIKVLDYLDERYWKRQSYPILADLPAGAILPWYSREGTVPEGWAICDGSNGTPDLRKKFLRGVSSFSDVGSSGGQEEIRLPESDITVYASGWDNHLTESPNGGPQQNQSWGDRQWHRLKSKGKIPAIEFDTIPPYMSVLFIMKLEPKQDR